MCVASRRSISRGPRRGSHLLRHPNEQLILKVFLGLNKKDNLLRKASTQALISVWRWSGVELLEGDEAKLDGVSIMIPAARPV